MGVSLSLAEWIKASTEILKILAWPAIVGWLVWDLRDEVKTAAARIIGGRLQANSGERIPQGGRGFRQSDVGTRLVFAGDPQRGIAPCSACHGPGGYKIGAPALAGQYAAYIERQLAGFAQGIRHNDIYEQ